MLISTYILLNEGKRDFFQALNSQLYDQEFAFISGLSKAEKRLENLMSGKCRFLFCEVEFTQREEEAKSINFSSLLRCTLHNLEWKVINL